MFNRISPTAPPKESLAKGLEALEGRMKTVYVNDVVAAYQKEYGYNRATATALRKIAAPRWHFYAIQVDPDGPVKLGISQNVQRRLEGLQTAAPYRLKLLVAVPGFRETEKSVHARFQDARIGGEWFNPTPELLDFIHDLKTRDCTAPQ
jgi:hypothetical protein